MDRHTYVPPHVQQAMDRQMQRTMPANLRKYTQENHGYIPQHAQKALAQHMEKAVPSQFKKYANAYVQQKVMSQHMAIASAMPQSVPNPVSHSSVPNLLSQDHSHPPEEQHIAQPATKSIPGTTVYPVAPEQPQSVSPSEQPVVPTPTFQPEQPPGPSPTSIYPPGPALPPVPQPQPYDFITNPEQPARQRRLPSLPGVSPTVTRAIFIAIGLVVLLILFIIIKGLLSGGSNLTSFVGIAQDQQELIHLATNASQQQGITTSNQNFAATTHLSLSNAQAAIIKYMVTNGQKVNPKTLNLKVSTATDNQLTAASAATTYDQTFQEIMKTKLTAYLNALQQTYKQINGKKGRALLTDDYKQAQLLLIQLNPPAQ
jgi:hypothetical protein